MSDEAWATNEALETRLHDLSPDKRALYELLLADDLADRSRSETIGRRPDSDVAPLSFAQERLWFLEQLMPDTALFTLTSTWRVQEGLDTKAFQPSVDEVVRRHESLRSTFAVRHGEPVQVISPELPLPVDFEDLRFLEPGEKAAATADIVARESQHCFKLKEGPLIRATLVRLAPDDSLVVVTMHHIISDGWSMSIFWNELSTVWRAYSLGQPSPLDPVQLQFGDVAEWEKRRLQGSRLATLLAYWRERLKDLSPLEFPLDRPRPATPSGRGAATYLSIPRSLTDAVRGVSHEAGTTLFMTLLAAFQALLHRYTGQDDIVVGTYTANRNRAEEESIIGFFVNPLVLRANFSTASTFRSMLVEVRRTALDAYAHQDLPFARLVQELSPDRDLSRNPLFQIAFQMLNAPDMGSASTPAEDDEPEVPREAAILDLTCTVWENTGGLGLEFEYNTDIFAHRTIESFSERFRTLLGELVSNPDLPLRSLPLLTADERRTVIEDWNDTAREYSDDRSLSEMFQAQVAQHPERTAVRGPDGAVSYRDLGGRALHLAARLRDLGVGPEVRVGICLQRSPDLVAALLAVLRLGGVYVPLDPGHPRERLAYMIEDAGVGVLVASSGTSRRLPFGTTPRLILDEGSCPVSDGEVANPFDVGSESTAYVIYTSGSTGRPKGIAVPHAQLLNRLRWMWEQHPFEPGEVACQKTSVGFVDSLWELLGALLAGVQTVLIPDDDVRDPEALTQTLQRSSVTRIWLVPSLLRELLISVPDLRLRLPALRFWVSSGEVLPRDLVDLFRARLPEADLYNLYGTSEVWDATWGEVGQAPFDGPVPIGQPIANTQAYVLDDLLEPVPVGAVGELYIGGLGLGRGYLGQPAATAAAFLPHPFSPVRGQRLYRTGDLARYQPGGAIVLLGRRDSLVKLRGHRIELDEIEATLMRTDEVRRAVVILRDDGLQEPHLVAYVQPENAAPTAEQDLAGRLRKTLRQTLPECMIPTSFVPMSDFPLTSSGKIDRRALPAPHSERGLPRNTFVAPRTAIEAQLADLWASLLGVDQVGVQDSFFELGGHSLLGIRMVARVRDELQVELPLRAIFEARTVAALALRVEMGRASEGAVPAPAIVRRPREDHAMRLLPTGELVAGEVPPTPVSVASHDLSP